MNHDPSNPHDLHPDPNASPESDSSPPNSRFSGGESLDSGAPVADPAKQNDAPWTWADIGIFALFGLVSTLILTLLLAEVAIQVFGVPREQLAAHEPNAVKAVLSIVIQTALSGAALLYLFLVLRTRVRTPFWQTIGWRGLPESQGGSGASAMRYIGAGAGLAIVISLAGKLVAQPEELPIEQLFRSRAAVILLMGFGILIAPVVEETIFRGFLYPVMARQFGMPAGVILTGLFFGAIHAAQLWGGWGQIALVMIVGVVLTWVRARTGSVTASYLVHLGYNSLLFLGFFAATSGLKNIPGGQ